MLGNWFPSFFFPFYRIDDHGGLTSLFFSLFFSSLRQPWPGRTGPAGSFSLFSFCPTEYAATLLLFFSPLSSSPPSACTAVEANDSCFPFFLFFFLFFLVQ